MIKLVFSSDARGFSKSATVIASIVRRTGSPVHVRYWCSGFLPKDIEVDRLKVEFYEVLEEEDGKYPGHVPPAVFNRLRVIKDCPDWDRCLVMDHDMAVFCDMKEYFQEDFEGNLLMGRLFGEGNTLGLQMQQRGGLPDSWKHADDHPYFFMGPMLNLAAMRESGTWEKLLKAHKEIGQDEQLSLTAACDGRVKGVDKKWNIVPQWDHLDELEKKLEKQGLEEAGGFTWHNGVPRGLIHWSEWAKPWHHQSSVWRADLWQGERTTWEQLRLGQWEKPLAIIVRGDDEQVIRSLTDRGWQVKIYDSQCKPLGSKCDCCQDDHHTAFHPSPDLEFRNLDQLGLKEVQKASLIRVAEAETLTPGQRELLKAGKHLTLVGPLQEKHMAACVRPSTRSLVVKRYSWPAGGTHPGRLTYRQTIPENLEKDEDVYLAG